MSGGERPGMFINRELSWLAFNERVLEEAQDRGTPLLERLKFVAIVASNLDEFFMVRVAGLQHAVEEGDESPDIAGLTPSQQLAAIAARAHAMVASLYRLTIDELIPALNTAGVRIVAWKDIKRSHQAALGTFFREQVLPVLTPLAIDMSRPFPLLSSLSLNLALRLDAAPGETGCRLAIVQVPPGLTRLVQLAEPGTFSFVLLEAIISAHLPSLFPGQPILESAVIRLARDAELELDDEGGRTQLELVERELRRRRRSDVVRLEVSADASDQLVSLLRDQLDVGADDVYVIPGPLDLRVMMGLVDLPGLDRWRDPPVQPVNVLAAAQHADLFSVLEERDVLLQHPYEAYDPIVALLAQAADDPDVLAIKQTLYRTSIGSPIIASLQRAAERNKQVTVLLELTARFDEERNIRWARALEEAGAHVIYGVHGYKTHAKICLIVRRTPHGVKRYVHLGTGNYNERTARIYTDIGLLTTSEAIAEDATAVFGALTGYSDPPRLKKLVMAPTALRRRFVKLIDRERRRAESGQPAEIVAKMNSLIDTEIIDALYAASQAGVKVRLNVRGICALRPGMPDVSANIEVVSIVDRYLEHSRIYYFLNGGEDEVYLASADWMTRNLDKRIELMFPVEQAEHKARVIYTLRSMFRDTVKSRWLGADGVYRRLPLAPGEAPFRVQEHLQEEARRLASLARDRAGVSFRPEGRQKRTTKSEVRRTKYEGTRRK
jgi:polyphosphate kinase